MEKNVISTPDAPAAIGPYSQAILAGDTLYSSGQLGLDPATGELPEGAAAQAHQSLANIKAILDKAGFQKTDVVKTTVFLTDMGAFAAVNDVYAAVFGEHRPARSCVEVAALPKGGLVEIEFTAVR